MKIYIVIILNILLIASSNAQFYLTGTDNPNQKLLEIKTTHFEVVFPENYLHEGQRLANMLEQTYNIVKKDLDVELKKKIPVLLHTGTIYSNAFVSIAPSRTEINYISPQRSYSSDWMEHVVIHEMQHVIQTGKLEEGIYKIFKVLLGEGAKGIIAGQFPIWAYEGDAVVTETALTKSGRGRSPSFLMDLKAITLEGKKYSYEKAYFGSYHDHVPSYYAYGYTMSSVARVEYDSIFWKNMLEYIPKKTYTLYPSYFSVKKNYNISKKDLYNQSIEYFKVNWENSTKNNEEYKSINSLHRNEYTDYMYPVITEKGNSICLKKQNSKSDRIISIDKSGHETLIAFPGLNDIERLSYAGGILVWAEIKNHPRWEKEEHSVICVLDINNNEKKIIGRGSKYVVPALNAEGDKIIAVEAGLPGYENLVVFNVNTGNVLAKYKIENAAIQIPSWHQYENKVVYTKITTEGKFIEEIDLSSGLRNTLFGPVNYDMLSPVYKDENIVFSAAISGTDNLYELDPTSKEIYKLTRSKYGAFDPQINANNNEIIFNEYSSLGYNVAYSNFTGLTREKVKFSDFYEPQIVKELKKQTQDVFSFSENEAKKFEVNKYCRFKNMFHFHTWAPVGFEPVPQDIFHGGLYPGVTLFTQNLTETLYGYGGYAWKEGHHTANANFTVNRFWPVFSIDYQIGGKPLVLPHPEQTGMPDPEEGNRQHLLLSTYVPLFFNKGPALISFEPRVNIDWDDAYNYNETTGTFTKGLTNLQYSGTFYIYSRLARKDIYPSLGFFTRARFYQTPFEDNYGELFNLNSRIYLPGFFTNHSIRFSYQFQNQNSGALRYPYSLRFPRGYPAYHNNRMNMFTADYALPLFYPDWTLGSIAYIKRFKSNVFYDRAFVEDISTGDRDNPFINEYFQSVGVELTSDMHVAHIFLPISFGVRVTYKMLNGETIFEPLISLNLY